MGNTPRDTHQLAGLDPRERGFSRPIELIEDDHRFRALLRYETTRVLTDSADSPEAALRLLMETLHAQGYRQLKTQMSFHDGIYLGSRESWVEYSDPPPVHQRGVRLFAAIRNWFHRDKLTA
ncbi:MAG TPA: hypothetical protein VJR03_15730 [Nitrospira sp.]|nr:hypothetical protein [Nitrospira sp.]